MEPGDGNGDAAADAFFGPWSINERKEKPVQFLREVVVRFALCSLLPERAVRETVARPTRLTKCEE
jgi:hypothetical protein